MDPYTFYVRAFILATVNSMLEPTDEKGVN